MKIFPAILTFALVGCAAVTQAETPLPTTMPIYCTDSGYTDATDKLAERYGERSTWVGLSDNSVDAVELFLSDDGTWTILVRNVAGEVCVIGSGHSGSLRLVGAPA